MDELALESFGALDEELRGARAEAGGEAVEKLLSVGVAYVYFALHNPVRFRFMFRSELRTGHRRELAWATGGNAEESREKEAPGRRAARGLRNA